MELECIYIDMRIIDDYPFEALGNDLGIVENFCKNKGLNYSVSDDYQEIYISAENVDEIKMEDFAIIIFEEEEEEN